MKSYNSFEVEQQQVRGRTDREADVATTDLLLWPQQRDSMPARMDDGQAESVSWVSIQHCTRPGKGASVSSG
jgi:hypothetical protein